MDNFDLKKYLAEGRLLKENTNPIWTIEASEDDADISDAGLEYIRAVGTIIDKALPDMSIEDMIASMDVINNFWYDEARKNAKGSEPEEIKVSAIDFADSVIEHYEDVLMDKDINESQNRIMEENKITENKIKENKMDNFDLKKYLAEGKLLKDEFYEFIGVDPITESNILDQDFKVLKNQQDILKKVSNFYREKAEELKIDRKLIGDFNAAINALEDAIFKGDLAEGKLLKENISKDVKEISIENHKDEALETISEFIDEFEPQGLFEFIPDLDNYEIDSSTNSLNIDELGSVYLISNEGPIPSEVKELMMDSNNGEMNEDGATWKKYPKRGYYYIVVS